MTLHIFLDERILSEQEFKINIKPETGEYKGVRIHLNEKAPCVKMATDEDWIPKVVEPFLKSVSVWDAIPNVPHREYGVYGLETAIGTVKPPLHGSMYGMVSIRAGKLGDALDLLHRIKTGAILPEESYEAPQGGRTREWLERENAELLQTLEVAQRDRGELRIERDGYREAYELCKKQWEESDAMLTAANGRLERIRTFVRTPSWWPLMISWRVKSKIGKIVFD